MSFDRNAAALEPKLESGGGGSAPEPLRCRFRVGNDCLAGSIPAGGGGTEIERRKRRGIVARVSAKRRKPSGRRRCARISTPAHAPRKTTCLSAACCEGEMHACGPDGTRQCCSTGGAYLVSHRGSAFARRGHADLSARRENGHRRRRSRTVARRSITRAWTRRWSCIFEQLR
jgi:hypothetical protein